MAFPDNDHIPTHPPAPDERWVIIVEVISNPASRPGGPGFMVQDKIGDRFPVVFSTPTAGRDVRRYKPGQLICLANGSTMDFQQKLGYVVRDRSSAYTIPCSLATLRRLSARLRDAERCRTRYCGAECQRRDWINCHSKECRAIEALIIWNRTEWW
ncbi:hypothetical protein DFH09DRAFT_1077738 [Mycena vulgaris]|nr:hypothetical protein DFH09DRAFT_1077738 [Mycena vulgaris]